MEEKMERKIKIDLSLKEGQVVKVKVKITLKVFIQFLFYGDFKKYEDFVGINIKKII